VRVLVAIFSLLQLDDEHRPNSCESTQYSWALHDEVEQGPANVADVNNTIIIALAQRR
jgi:hypothetical protein